MDFIWCLRRRKWKVQFFHIVKQCCNEKIMETAEIDRSCSSCEETICSLRGAVTWYGQWPFLKGSGRDWRSEENRNRQNVIHFCTGAMSAWLACKKSTKHFPCRVVSGIHHFATFDSISWRIFIVNFKVKSRLSPAVDLKFRILRLLAKCIFSKTVFHVFEVQYTQQNRRTFILGSEISKHRLGTLIFSKLKHTSQRRIIGP